MQAPNAREAGIMAGIRRALCRFLTEKSNCYSMLMVLTTLSFVAFMVAGTAALQVELIAKAPPQDNPAVAEITVGPLAAAPLVKDMESIAQITQQIVRGNVTNLSRSGEGAQVLLNIGEGDIKALVNALTDAGIAKPDATELAQIFGSEEAESMEEPFGTKAKAWLVRNIRKAADGTWKMGIAVATRVLTEAAMRYYGFK